MLFEQFCKQIYGVDIIKKDVTFCVIRCEMIQNSYFVSHNVIPMNKRIVGTISK